ncbi:hypothetical protein [Streptomyces sp. NPDC052042]|uniref:hypothetical protein n=1 Tax=Streptomyces sp. NPDC052042 TaxID=3365683 RepID=UPI0037CCFDFE
MHAGVLDRVAALTEVVRALQDAGIAAEDIGLRRPTLDDVFLALTGSPASEGPVSEGPASGPRAGRRTGTTEKEEVAA